MQQHTLYHITHTNTNTTTHALYHISHTVSPLHSQHQETHTTTTTMSIANLVTSLLLLLCLASPCFSSPPLFSSYPSSSHPNTTWINNDSLNYNTTLIRSYTTRFSDGSRVRPILLKNSSGLVPAFGFFCNGTCNASLLSVFFVRVSFYYSTDEVHLESDFPPQVTWSANRNRMVGENATLELKSEGNLVLRDVDGVIVWSTNTSGKGVTGLSLEDSGNLVLADGANKRVWKSSDHPTDCMVLGQVLAPGMKLVASVSSSNYTEGPYYLSMEKDGLHLYAAAAQPQQYWNLTLDASKVIYRELPYAQYRNGSIGIFVSNISHVNNQLPKPQGSSYLKIDPDGGLRAYSDSVDGWTISYDFLANYTQCSTPGICGSYGLCKNGECSCLLDSSGQSMLPTNPTNSLPRYPFRQLRDVGHSTMHTDPDAQAGPPEPSEGCVASFTLVCDSSYSSAAYYFLVVRDVDYFALPFLSGYTNVSFDDCMDICLKNCSCKAAFFKTGTCYPITEVFTVRNNSSQRQKYNSVALIKLPNPPPSKPRIAIIVVVAFSSVSFIASYFMGVSNALEICKAFGRQISTLIRRIQSREDTEDDYFSKLAPGLPSRFSFLDLRNATDDFRNRLGSGGFGSVFLGVLPNESRVAVKRLESARQGEKEFRTEVRTIGSIHHLNLVRLCGFCAERNQRLLVYEFMPNGSLDRWLFSADDGFLLDWDTRFSIALGTAHGLSYLHEDCRERILHLDVKPHNILLDEHFVAKVSDFGLSKLMDRDESHVITTMRGTPGYLAPEWLHSTVTQKADVYSFGIVLLQIVSGRKCHSASDDADSQEEAYLPVWARRKAEGGKLMELVDGRLGGNFDEKQAERVIKVALWCLEGDVAGRPWMSSVVQMLEGVMEVPPPPLNFPHLWSAPTKSTTTGLRAPGRDGGNINIGSRSDMPKGSIPIASQVSTPR